MIPIYIEGFGLAAYGMIGFYFTLMFLMGLMDFGVSYAANKSIAESNIEDINNVTSTLKVVEKLYLIISLILGLVTIACTDLITSYWITINDPNIDGDAILSLIGILIIVSWPQNLYQAMLGGQKRFIAINSIFLVFDIVTSIVFLLAILLLNIGIAEYFKIMIVLSFCRTVILRIFSWKKLPMVSAKFDLDRIRSFFKYSSGVASISPLVFAFFQAPILFLTYYANISDVGLYNVALVFPMGVLTIQYPITSALFPRLVNAKKEEAYVAKVFEEGISIACLFAFIGGSMMWINMPWIYDIWLGEFEGIETVITISKFLLLGTLTYSIFFVISTTLLANNYSLQLGAAYAIALIVMFFTMFKIGDDMVVEIISKSWAMASITLLVIAAVIFKLIYSNLFAIWIIENLKTLLLSILTIFSCYFFIKFFLIDGAWLFILSCTITLLVFWQPMVKAFLSVKLVD